MHADTVYLDLCGIQLPDRVIELISEALLAIEEHCEIRDTALGCSGRPKFDISSEQLTNLSHGTWLHRGRHGYYSRCITQYYIARRLRELGLSVERKYCVISNEDLDDLVLSILQQYPECGQKMMHGHLKERGILIQQTRV